MESLMDAIRYFELGFLHEVKNYAIKKDELEEYEKIAYLDILGGKALNCIAAFTYFLPQKKFLDLIDLDSDEEVSGEVKIKLIELVNMLTQFNEAAENKKIEICESLIDKICPFVSELDEIYESS